METRCAISRPRLARGQLFEREDWWMYAARGGEREEIEKKEEETADGGGRRGKKGPTGRRGCTCHVVARPYKADDPEETRGGGATSNARVSRLKRRLSLEITIDRSILRFPWNRGAQTREADVSAIDIEFHTTSCHRELFPFSTPRLLFPFFLFPFTERRKDSFRRIRTEEGILRRLISGEFEFFFSFFFF